MFVQFDEEFFEWGREHFFKVTIDKKIFPIYISNNGLNMLKKQGSQNKCFFLNGASIFRFAGHSFGKIFN